jgi:hypothetical protein
MKSLLFLLPIFCLSQASYGQSTAQDKISVGLDLYGGGSNLPGLRHFTDQLWAGRELFTPSVAYLRWESSQGTTARLALGVGDVTRGSNALYKQPVELWVKHGSVTAGRFFTHFGQQEWQYEAKEGLQWEGALGSLNVTAALQKSPTSPQSHGYVRLLHAPNTKTQLGLSVASGEGFSYGTILNRGIGADASLTRGAWLLRSELDSFSGAQQQRFHFGMLSATYQGLAGEVRPFVSYYDWQDSTQAQALGSFHSLIAGVGFPVTGGLSAELAGSKANKRFNGWLQLHFTWEH